jgi:hypothetical protein
MPDATPPAVCEDPQSAWTALKKEFANSKPALASTLADCQLTVDDGGGYTYTLTVAGNKFAVNSVRKNIKRLERRLSALMGTAIALKVAAAQRSEQADRRQKKNEANALKNAALGHPLGGEVVERFQGEVVEVKLLK